MKIKNIKARVIHNSRNDPAIEIIINKKFSASTPSGASTGKHEVAAFPKKGIDFAVDFVNNFKDFKKLKFEEFEDLEVLEKLIPLAGGNTILAIQTAILRAMSDNEIWSFFKPSVHDLPTPLGNVVGGGAHTKRKNSLDVQEFLLIPRTNKFEDRVFLNNYVYHKLGKFLKAKSKTDEGAWMPPNLTDAGAFMKIHEFLLDKDNTLGKKVELGIDLAASELWNGKNYKYKNFSKKSKSASLTSKQQVDFVNKLVQDYDLKYVEDGLREDDFTSFSKLKVSMNCGDDLTTTNLDRLKKAVKQNSINTIIVKPNQIGSLVQTKKLVDFCHRNNITSVISHRSGETMDTLIANLAVAWNIPYIKCSPFGKERTVKFDEIKRIEKQL